MESALKNIQGLVKALEAGSYNAAPSTLTQGSALQIEDLSPVIENVCAEEKSIILQKMISVKSCKSTTAQFNRKLSYGQFGGSAQLEGHVGQEETSEHVRITVPMAYYSQLRRVTLQSTLVDTVDGQKSDDREAADAALNIASDIEFDLFRGRADFSNAGTFDGHSGARPSKMANMIGLDVQIRESDSDRKSQDLMFNEFGSDESVVISGGGTLTQDLVEDAWIRSTMNHGSADRLLVDPLVLSAYNKIVYGKERIILAGSAQGSTGGDLRKQFVSGGQVDVEASRFLSGKTRPAVARASGPTAPTFSSASTTVSGVTTAFRAAQVYTYYVTTGNETGESVKSAAGTRTVAVTGDVIDITITHPGSGTSRFFNVYRSPANGTEASAKFIGRVLLRVGQSTTVFRDLGNKQPGFVTGYMVQKDCMDIAELSSYSRIKMAMIDLSQTEAHYRFCTLRVRAPRKMTLIDNLR